MKNRAQFLCLAPKTLHYDTGIYNFSLITHFPLLESFSPTRLPSECTLLIYVFIYLLCIYLETESHSFAQAGVQ